MRMRKKKHRDERIERCADIMIQSPSDFKGNWDGAFGRKAPLFLEIGCGKGRFICETAKQNPENNYLAVEKCPDVVLLAMEKAKSEEIPNLKFFYGDVNALYESFEPSEVDGIYLNFSDPWPKNQTAKRRLTHPKLLNIYKKVLKHKGRIYFKTDNRKLFDYSLKTFEDCGFKLYNLTYDLHSEDIPNIMTEYETLFSEQGVPINRVEAENIKPERSNKMYSTKEIFKNDPEVAEAIEAEATRQRNKIELIASENFVSEAVMEAVGSPLTNKYAEGYPGKRYYGGCECVDIVENLARERAKQLFGADHANVQPHSGAQANMAVYFAMVKPGETVMGMNLAHGGHLTHGSPVNMSGTYFNIVPYGVDDETHRIDYDALEKTAKEVKPRMIIAGASAYPRIIDFERFSHIAKSVGAYLMVDMAHIAGLVAAGLHPNPVPYADFVTTTTHKTLRGPRGGMILCKEEYAKQIDKAIFPGIQGGPLMHVIAGKAVCLGEALKDDFKEYQKQIVKNASVLADALLGKGFNLVSGGTDNHLMLVDLRPKCVTGKAAEHMLDEIGITVNKNAIPNDPEKPFVTSGIRIGTPAVTTRGFKEADMLEIAEIIDMTLSDFENNKEEASKRVLALTSKYKLYE